MLGLLIGSFLHFYTAWMQKENLLTTRARLKEIRFALTAYVATHERLPCPESPSGPAQPKADGDDAAKPPQDRCASGAPPPDGLLVVKTDPNSPDDETSQIWIGVLPVQELRLDGDESRDAWGNQFTYAVSRALTLPAGMKGNPPPPGIISVHDANGNSLLDKPDTGRYVVVSHGPTGAGAWTPAGQRTPCPADTLDAQNCNGGKVFVSAPWSKAHNQGFYDDVVIHDDSNVGGTLLDHMRVCNAAFKFYTPTTPGADANGCMKRQYWEGACLQTTVTDQKGNETIEPPLVIMAPAASVGNACGCNATYTSVRIGAWDGGVNLSGGQFVPASCPPKGGDWCMMGQNVQFKKDPKGHIIDYTSTGVSRLQTALYVCVQ